MKTRHLTAAVTRREGDDHSVGPPATSRSTRIHQWACPRCGTAMPRPLAVTIKEFCRLVSLGRTTAFALARDRKIEVRHVAGRTLVLTRSIDALLELSDPDRGGH